MIKIIDDDRNRTLELSKPTKRGSILNVDVLDSNGDLDYYYVMRETELLEFLKKFEKDNNIS